MFARHRHAARMDHGGLDLPRPQPTREPKPIASSLEGNDDPADRLARLDGFVSPTMQKLKQRIRVGILLLQWLAGDAGHQAGDQPPCQTQLDYSHKRAILIEGDEGPAEIILWHGAPFGWLMSNDGATPSSPAP